MKTEQVNHLVSGVNIQNIRNDSVFLVEDVNKITKKALIMNVETKEEKEVAFGTIRRNYDLVQNDKKAKKSDDSEKSEKSDKKEHKSVPKPKATTTIKPSSSKPSVSNIHELVGLLEKGIKEKFPNSKQHVTNSYLAYRGKRNFVEIYEGKRAVTLNIRTSRLSQEQLNKLDKIYSKENGWSLDGKLILKDKEDVEKAFEFIEVSYLDSEGLSNANRDEEDNETEESYSN